MPTRSIKLMMRSGRLGGMEIRMLDEAEWLKHAGWRPEIVFNRFRESEGFLSLAEARSVPAWEINFPLFMETWRWRHLRALKARLRAIRLAGRLECEVAHVPFAWTDQGLSMLWLASRVSHRCVVSVHNVFPHWRMTDWHRSQLRAAFSKVVGVYGVSAAATAGFVDNFGELLSPGATIHSVPNFVDCERFVPNENARQEVRRELGIPQDALVIAVLGRISEQKRPLVVVETLARLAVQPGAKPVWLLFIGGGELEEDVWNFAYRAGVADRMRVTGFVEKPETYLASADMHLLASVREGYASCTIEAMACGLPVIATNTPASRETLQDKEGGILVAGCDTSNIVAGVQQLLVCDEERHYRARKSREEALGNFSQPLWRDRLSAFYAEALTGDPTPCVR